MVQLNWHNIIKSHVIVDFDCIEYYFSTFSSLMNEYVQRKMNIK